MMIAWYQPREVMTQKRLVHLCPDNPKTTLCGLKINYNWILWDRDGAQITCKKCAKFEDKNKVLLGKK